MVGLLDIAPSARTVKVGGADVAVYGISAEGIVYLITRFPELKQLLGGKLDNISPETIANVVPSAIAAVIAAGCGYIDNRDAEAVAAKLSIDAQMDILKEVINETMPKGVGPFLEKFNDAMRVLSVPEGLAKAQDTPSPSLSSS